MVSMKWKILGCFYSLVVVEFLELGYCRFGSRCLYIGVVVYFFFEEVSFGWEGKRGSCY